MDPLYVGRNIYASVSEFRGRHFFHLRRHYFNTPSKYGISFTVDEFTALRKMMATIHRSTECNFKLCYALQISCSTNWVTFYKNDSKKISIHKDSELEAFKTSLETAYGVMEPEETRPTTARECNKDFEKENSPTVYNPIKGLRTQPVIKLTCPMCHTELVNTICVECGYTPIYSDHSETVL